MRESARAISSSEIWRRHVLASPAVLDFGRPSPSGDRFLPTPAWEPWVPGSQAERGAATPASDESRRMRRNAVSHPILQHAGAKGYGTSFLYSVGLVGIRGLFDQRWRRGTNENYRPVVHGEARYWLGRETDDASRAGNRCELWAGSLGSNLVILGGDCGPLLRDDAPA